MKNLKDTNPMQVTEQNKQEAEKVVEKHTFVSQIQRIGIGQNVYQQTNKIDAIKHAIQDRQSVLDLAKRLRSNSMSASSLIIDKEITNLTEQIEFLKSKL